ncbi:hypothetical protein D9M70_322740 [compost metagenome]
MAIDAVEVVARIALVRVLCQWTGKARGLLQQCHAGADLLAFFILWNRRHVRETPSLHWARLIGPQQCTGLRTFDRWLGSRGGRLSGQAGQAQQAEKQPTAQGGGQAISEHFRFSLGCCYLADTTPPARLDQTRRGSARRAHGKIRAGSEGPLLRESRWRSVLAPPGI